MPIIKYIPVHSSPLRLLKYITREGKKENVIVSGLNISDETQIAYDTLNSQFERFGKERFYKKSLDGTEENKKKNAVRIHHYIQSFKPGEVTPEEAHQIGLEWAKKVFGDNHSVLVSTHTEKGHIHNHFAVSVFDFEGKRWYANRESLNLCKRYSDEIAKNHGLSVIEHPKYKAKHKYYEYQMRKKGSSWKQKLCDDIDSIVVKDSVHSIDDLIKELKKKGYGISRGKYISIRVRRDRKPIRTFRLGDGYSLEHLQYRIQNKNMEMPLEKALAYNGIQREYALFIRQIQIDIYRNGEADRQHFSTYREIEKSLDMLRYISDNGISSVDDWNRMITDSDKNINSILDEKEKILEALSEKKRIFEEIPKYLEIKSRVPLLAKDLEELSRYVHLQRMGIENSEDAEPIVAEIFELQNRADEIEAQIKAEKKKQKTAAEYLDTYRNKMKSDYEIMLERAKAELEEQQMLENQGRQVKRGERNINNSVR